MKRAITFFNWFVIISTAIGLGWLAAIFFLGTTEDHFERIQELPYSFFKRLIVPVFTGVVMMVLLVLLNWILNSGVNQDSPVKLNKLFWKGVFVITMSSVIGCLCFFRILG